VVNGSEPVPCCAAPAKVSRKITFREPFGTTLQLTKANFEGQTFTGSSSFSREVIMGLPTIGGSAPATEPAGGGAKDAGGGANEITMEDYNSLIESEQANYEWDPVKHMYVRKQGLTGGSDHNHIM
jgi:hypothetical protein